MTLSVHHWVTPSAASTTIKTLPRQRLNNRLATKYLWLSLLVALVPLMGFAGLYDAYFSQLVTRLTEEQLATRIAATQNEFRVFIRERKFELEALADQLDNPALFSRNGRTHLSAELESVLHLQVDARSVYGVVFFDPQGRIAWTFPEQQQMNATSLASIYDFEEAELIGPTPYSIERPARVILRKAVSQSSAQHNNHNTPNPASIDSTTPSAAGIGLMVRFNSLTEILRDLNQISALQVFLQAGDGNIYDVVGQPVNLAQTLTQQRPLLPGWALHVVQNNALAMPPAERMRYWLITLMAGTVAGLLWLHMSISRRLNQQVESVINSVEQVARGNLDTPISTVQGTEMYRLTDAVERMRLQLKTVIRSTVEIERQATLGQLAAGLAHDIRNPLTTIRTTVVALARREKDPENKDMMRLVEEEINRVNNVLEHLLNFARPREPHASAINVQTLLNSITTLVSASARQQHITLQTQCDDTLMFWVDEGHIRQVLMNITLNALEAMSVRGHTITLSAEGKGNTTIVRIIDDGPGIPEAIQTQVMEPFFTTKSAGTGLGLAICATLIKSNSGTLAIDSTEHKGTTLSITLPASAPTQEYAL